MTHSCHPRWNVGEGGRGGRGTRSQRDDKRPTNSNRAHEALCPTQMYQIAKGQPPRQVNTLFLGLRGCGSQNASLNNRTHQSTILGLVWGSRMPFPPVAIMKSSLWSEIGVEEVWNEGILGMFKNLDRT